MSTHIVYFSGTGNTFDIAKRLSLFLGCDISFIPSASLEKLKEYNRIIVVSPIYSFGLPIPVKEFIATLKNFNDTSFDCVLNYGGFAGNAVHYAQSQFLKYGLTINKVYKMKMPENFTIVAQVPTWYIKKCLNKTEKFALKIANSIKNNTVKVHKPNPFSFLTKTHEANSEKWKNHSKGYIVTDSCTGCGYCESICTSKNIKMVDGKPTFGGNCVVCLACYHRCPTVAIQYGEKTIGRPRYQNPNVNFSKMK